MLKLSRIKTHLRVVDEATLEEWLFPAGDSLIALGACGPDHFWTRDRSGTLTLFDFRSRSQISSLQLAAATSSIDVQNVPGRDGKTLFAIDRVDSNSCAMHVIDVASGREVRTIGGLPLVRVALERPDGNWLLLSHVRGVPGSRVTLLDAATGAQQEEVVPELPYSNEFKSCGFVSESPDGRYLVRIDHGRLAVHDPAAKGLLGLFGRKSGERHYGLTLQIWEAWPPRFVRRVVAVWRRVEELPDATYLAQAKGHPDPTGARRAIWDAIAEAGEKTAAQPLDPPAPRSAYAEPFRDDAGWSAIQKNLSALVDQREIVIAWQPDGEAFWVKSFPYVACVGVDGRISPRLMFERFAAKKPTMARNNLTALPGRKARVVLPDGEGILDGAPSPSPYEPLLISTVRDQWVTNADLPLRKAEERAKETVRLRAEERQKIRISLLAWSEEGVRQALRTLFSEVGPDLHQRAVDSHIDLGFVVAEQVVSDRDFFVRILKDFPGAVADLRRVVDRLVEVTPPNHFLFSVGEDGAGLFANAVKTLGLLDLASIPTLQAYGRRVDAGHEYFFAGDTVPAMIARHGWTDEILDFVFWVLIRNYYNTIQDYGGVWSEWGMRDACVKRDPVALAQHVMTEFAPMLTGDLAVEYGMYGLEKLGKDIPQPHEPWATAFFAEVQRLTP